MHLPEHTPTRGDEFLSRLLQGEIGGGELENSLLRQFQEGYPLTKLRLLLNSSDDRIAAAGMWIASELGVAAKPLLADIVRLIRHRAKQVRFFALDCLIACAGPHDEQAVNLGLDLLDDAEPGVTWKAMVFVASAPVALLRAARDTLAAGSPQVTRAQGLDLSLRTAAPRDVTAISDALVSNDALLRRYAAAAAARLAHRDPSALKKAMVSEDLIVRQFAADMAARAGLSA